MSQIYHILIPQNDIKKNLKKKKKEKRRGLLSTFSLISPLLKKMFCTWLIVQLAMYKTFSTFEF